jgi:putative addiction module component (TIGR02574 family)
MATTRDDIFRSALGLAAQDRADLIAALIDSLDTETEEGVEEAWRAEVERRAAELESGKVAGIPWDVVRARLTRAAGG